MDNLYNNWTDIDALKTFSGSAEYMYVILLALEYTKQDAIIELTAESLSSKIVIQKGRIVDVRGFGNLIKPHIESVPAGLGIGDFFGAAMGNGIPHDQIMDTIQKEFITSLLAHPVKTIQLHPFKKPKIIMKLKQGFARLLELGVKEYFIGQSPKLRYRDDLNSGIFVQLPAGVALPRLGLSPLALRMVRKVKSGVKVSEIANSNTEWEIFHCLYLLGILSIEPTEQSQSSKLAQNASDDQKKLAELKDWLTKNEVKEPHILLEIEQPNEVNTIVISQKSRALSSKLHPDRFVSYGSEVLEMAQRCFEVVTKAQDAMGSEEFRAELKARLDAEKRGEVYVSESSEKKAQLLYEKAKFLFRRNKITESDDLVEKAFSLDPYNWRLIYLRLQLQYKNKKREAVSIAEEALKIEGCKGHERLDIMTFAAEIFCAEKAEEHQKKGKDILASIRQIDPEFQRAKILARRLQRKKEDKPKPEKKKGFFSSLFRK